MAYKIILGSNKILYDTADEKSAIKNAKLTLGTNAAGLFSFDLLPNSEYYAELQPAVKNNTKSQITVLDGGEIIFRGRISRIDTQLFKVKSVEVEGDLANLNNTIWPPNSPLIGSVSSLISELIDKHNQMADADQRFINSVAVTTTPMSEITSDDGGKSIQEILTALLDTYGGQLVLTYSTNGSPVLRYYSDYNITSAQNIELGENIIDLKITDAAEENICSAIFPTGKNGLTLAADSYYNTFTFIGRYNGVRYWQHAQCVGDEDKANTYGVIVKSKNYPDAETTDALIQAAVNDLVNAKSTTHTITVRAVDLHYKDETQPQFKINQKVQVISTPHGVNTTGRLTKIALDLFNPQNTDITVTIES